MLVLHLLLRFRQAGLHHHLLLVASFSLIAILPQKAGQEGASRDL
jgi:hypothetical protein